jgi:predicted nucleic acid-binding protein
VILVDKSVWVDHLRRGHEALVGLLEAGNVLAHPFVIGELALGNIPRRDLVLRALQDLPQANVATDREVLRFIHQHLLFGLGIGYVDAHLLAAVRLSSDAALWTRDRRLRAAADRLGVAMARPR